MGNYWKVISSVVHQLVVFWLSLEVMGLDWGLQRVCKELIINLRRLPSASKQIQLNHLFQQWLEKRRAGNSHNNQKSNLNYTFQEKVEI